VFLTAEKLAPLVARYGQPRVVEITEAVSPAEMDMVLASRKDGRAHDVTCFILDGRGRVAVIRKHFHPPGVWRAPSGGIRPGEDVEAGIRREMREETGLHVQLLRYLLRIHALFVEEGGGREQNWVSHVFACRPVYCAQPAGLELRPEDNHEIASARWATVGELQGPIREALLATGRGLFRYRVALTDLAVAELRRAGLVPGTVGGTVSGGTAG